MFKIKVIFLLTLLTVLLFMPSNNKTTFVKAQSNAAIGTLAYTLNSRINSIQWNLNLSPLIQGVQYGIIFKQFNGSIYDNAATQLLQSQDWLDIIRLKRVAEVSGYDSVTLNDTLKQALENIPIMNGGLPVTDFDGSFANYYSFVLYGYKYAEQMGISRWNMQEGYNQLANIVNQSGGLGFLTTTLNSTTISGRYYDDEAETIRDFQILDEMGITGARQYEDEIWNNLLTEGWWNSQYGVFVYLNGTTTLECEMGGFASIISQYLGYPPQEVLSDINQKLLVNGWNSLCWQTLIVHPHSSQVANGYVIIHAITLDDAPVNPQPRPSETCEVWRVLQALYPSMSSSMQSNMANMLTQNGWQLTLNSGAFDSDTSAQLSGLMTAFQMGIIPKTASLNTGFDEESYVGNDIEYPANEYGFDYANSQITIPVKGPGELDFIFGTNITSAYFPETGVYTVTFSSDWNRVIETTLVSSSLGNYFDFVDMTIIFVVCTMIAVFILKRRRK